MRKIIFVLALAFSAPASAAYLIEIDTDGLDDGVLTFNPDFSFGGDTTIASPSSPSLAYGTSGADSIFGGDGVNNLDTYVFTYAPDSQADNLAIPANTNLGNGNLATGETGGGPGLYNVYATWPYTENVSGGDTEYTVNTTGSGFTVQIDQNTRGDEWILLGQVDYTSGDITVTQSPTVQNSFISQRAYGLLFEAVDDGVDDAVTAQFEVSKEFVDGNTLEGPTVRLSCNGGNELVQDFPLENGDSVTFNLHNFQPGETDCSVTELPLGGYIPEYWDGVSSSTTSCEFTDIVSQSYTCDITNRLSLVEWEVNKIWESTDEEAGFEQQATLNVICENIRNNDGDLLPQVTAEIGITPFISQFYLIVQPNWTTPLTRCRIIESFENSAMDSDQGCASWLEVELGDEEISCTITNTVFFEGIPALGRNGLLLLILLMAGIAPFAIRRWV